MSEGFCSAVYGQKRAHEVLQFGTAVSLPAEFVSLWLLSRPSGAAELRKEEVASGERNLAFYRYALGEEEHCIGFCDREKMWSFGPCRSDAEFLYWGTENAGGMRRLIVSNAAHLEIGGQTVFSGTHRVLRLEVISRAEKTEAFCSDDAGAIDKDAMARLCHEFVPALTSVNPAETGV